METLMQHTTPPVRLTRATLLRIRREGSDQVRQAMVENPHEYARVTVELSKEKLADQLVDGIQYERSNEWYEMTLFEEKIEGWEDHLVPAQRSMDDHVGYASEIERRFVEGLERRDDVKLYVILPGWFTVQTPVGDYTPDWTIVMEPRDEFGVATGEDLLYLVRETKRTHNMDELRPGERRKSQCGDRHFRETLQVDSNVAVTADELP